MMRRRIVGLAGATALALTAFTGTAVAAPPSCSVAEQHATWDTYEEAWNFGAIHGRGFRITSFYAASCFKVPSLNRTEVRAVFVGKNGFNLAEYVTVDVNVYPESTGCSSPLHDVNLGNLTLYYDQSDGVRRTGTMATPCD